MPKGGTANNQVKALNVKPGQHVVGAKRFKFQNFKELVARSSVTREVYRDGNVQVEPADGAQSFFQQLLADWAELDLSREFKVFSAEVYPRCQSLPQLIHYKDSVASSLLQRLNDKKSARPQALLQLTAGLARDLRSDFWPRFPDFVRAITSVINRPYEGLEDGADLFAAAFNCLASLFKYLLRPILGSPKVLLPLIQPLLGHERTEVQAFAAEAMAFLLRKLGLHEKTKDGASDAASGTRVDLSEMLHTMFRFEPTDSEPSVLANAFVTPESVEKQDALKTGIAISVYEAVKGIGTRLHSSGSFVLSVLFSSVAAPTEASRQKRSEGGKLSDEEMTVRRFVLRDVMHRLCGHLRSDTASSVWSLLHAEIESASEAWHKAGSPAETAEQQLELLLEIFKEWCSRLLVNPKPRVGVSGGVDNDPDTDESSGTNKKRKKKAANKKLNLSSVVVAPACELAKATRVWSTLKCVLGCLDGSDAGQSDDLSPLTDGLSAVALEAIWRALCAVPRLHCKEDGAAKSSCVHALTKGGIIDMVLAMHDSGDKVQSLVATSAAYSFLRKLSCDWHSFDSVATPVFKRIFQHVERVFVPVPAASKSKKGSRKSKSITQASTANDSQSHAAMLPLMNLIVAVHERCPSKLRHEDNNRLLVGDGLFQRALLMVQSENESASNKWLALNVMEVVNVPDMTLAISSIAAAREQCKSMPADSGREKDAFVTVSTAHTIFSASIKAQATLLCDSNPTQLTTLLHSALAYCREEEGFDCSRTLGAVTKCVTCLLSTRANSDGGDSSSGTTFNPLADDADWEALRSALIAPVLAVRAEAARLFEASARLAGFGQSDCAVFGIMVKIVESPLDFNHGRELSLEVSRLAHTAQKGLLSAKCRAIIPYFLIGLLKTKFTMIWKASTEALADEVSAQFDIVWPLVHKEMSEMQNLEGSAIFMLQEREMLRDTSSKNESSEEDEDDETQKSGDKDPETLATNSSTTLDLVEADFSQWRRVAARATDYTTYHKELWKVLQNSPAMFERKNRMLVEMYLDFLQTYKQLWGTEDESTEVVSAEISLTVNERRLNKRTMNAVLCDYLGLFAKFKNAGSMANADQVETSYEALLTKAEPEIQALALKCLITFRSKVIGPYEKALGEIIDEGTFKDALHKLVFPDDITAATAQFDDNPSITVVRKEHRDNVVPILVRILYGKLLNRKGRAFAKNSLSTRRTTVLAYMACLRSDELLHLVDLMMQPFSAYLQANSTPRSTVLSYEKQCSDAFQALEDITLTRRTGVVKMLADVLRQLSNLCKPYVPQFIRVQIGIVQASSHQLDQMAISDAESDMKDHSKTVQRNLTVDLRNLALKQMAVIIDGFPGCGFESVVTEFLESTMPLVKKLPSEGMHASNPTPILQCLLSLTAIESHVGDLVTSTYKPKNSKKKCKHVDILLDALISCLEQKSVAVTVLSAVLTVLHNIIADEKTRQAGTLKSHSNVLLSRLAVKITEVIGDEGGTSLNKTRSVWATKLFQIVSILATMIQDSTQLTSIGRMLLPFVKTRGMLDKDELVQALGLIEVLVPVLESRQEFSLSLARMLYTTPNFSKMRKALVSVYNKLGSEEPELESTAQWIKAMNAIATNRLDGYDFDSRLDAYSAFELDQRVQAGSLNFAQLIPPLYQFFHDVTDADTSIRSSGASSVMCVVRGLIEASKDAGLVKNAQKVIDSYLIPMLKQGLRMDDDFARDEFVRLLGSIVRLLPEKFSGLLALTDDTDPEVDVFNNIVHIQMHRRQRALLRLKTIVESGVLSPNTLVGFLLPLVTHFVYTASVVTSKGGTRGGKDVVKEGGHNLVTGAIECIGCIVKCLPWGKYNRVLLSFLHAIPNKKSHEKKVVRLVCTIIDNFHFGKHSTSAGDRAAPRAVDSDAMVEDVTDENSDGLNMSVIQKTLTNRVLPELYRNLTEDQTSQMDAEIDGRGVRQPVALAIVKLLKILPQASLQAQIPRLTTVLANSLKSHMQSVRDDSRKTLVAVLLNLGPYYLNFVVEELKVVLLRGYQRHVLAYTIHSILLALTPTVPVGAFDHCYDGIMPILQDELLGQLSYEKEVDALAKKMREYASGKGYACFKLFAEKVSFKNVATLLEPIQSALAAASSTSILSKIEELLKQIAHGLMINPSAKPLLVLGFCRTTIVRQLEVSKRDNELAIAKKRSYAEESAVVDDRSEALSERPEIERQNAHFITEFALGLAHVQLKRDGEGFKLRDEETVALLETLVPVLMSCLDSVEDKVLELTLKVFSLIVPCKLPTLSEAVAAKPLVRNVFRLIGTSGGTGILSSSCYRCAAVILRDLPSAEVTDSQLRILLRYVVTHFDGIDTSQGGSQSTTFSLLKAIVARKLISVEVYDAMDAAFKLMIRSHNQSTRTNCAQLLLQFLLEYPLGPKLLTRHINFVIKNLDYSHETGRESALGMLNAIVVKFPAEVLMEHMQYIFLSVVARLVSDESSRCRIGSAKLLRLCLERTHKSDAAAYGKILRFVVVWYEGDRDEMRWAAAQLVGIAAEVEGAAVVRHFSTWLPIMENALEPGVRTASEAAAEASAREGGNTEERNDTHEWRTAYYTLHSLEKLGRILNAQLYTGRCCAGEGGGLVLQSSQPRLWGLVAGLLQHPHPWIKLRSTRFFGAVFAQLATSAADEEECTQSTEELKLRSVEDGLVTQLRSQYLDLQLAEQATKNLLFVARSYHSAAESEADVQTHSNGQKKAKKTEPRASPEPADADSDASDAEPEADAQTEFGRLFGRLARLANSMVPGSTNTHELTAKMSDSIQELRRASCLKWLMAASRLADQGSESLTAHPKRAEFVLLAIFRILPGAGDASEHNVSTQLAALAQQVADQVKLLIGDREFAAAFKKVRERIEAIRSRRQRNRKTIKILDPQRNAKRLSKKYERKKSNKKRRRVANE